MYHIQSRSGQGPMYAKRFPGHPGCTAMAFLSLAVKVGHGRRHMWQHSSSGNHREVKQPELVVDTNRSWLFDSGAALHCLNKSQILNYEGRAKQGNPPRTLLTASSTIEVDHYIESCCLALGITLDVAVMEDSPELLSMGVPCKEKGASLPNGTVGCKHPGCGTAMGAKLGLAYGAMSPIHHR